MHQVRQVSQILLLHMSSADSRSGTIPAPSARKKMKIIRLTLRFEYSNYSFSQLPVKIDVIKHPNEKDGKSTAIHAVILAPANVSIYTYPDIPNYDDDPEGGTVSADFAHFRREN